MGYYPVTQPGSNWRWPGSNWRCTMKKWEAMDKSDRKGNSDYTLGKKSLWWGWWSAVEKCLEGLSNLHLWRSSRLDRTRPCGTWSNFIADSTLTRGLDKMTPRVPSSLNNAMAYNTSFSTKLMKNHLNMWCFILHEDT